MHAHSSSNKRWEYVYFSSLIERERVKAIESEVGPVESLESKEEIHIISFHS